MEMSWIKSIDKLPDFNRRVVAFCEGEKYHSGVSWKREGYTFMVRHKNTSHVVKDKWACSFYNNACIEIDADNLEVTYWMYLPWHPTKEG